LAAGVRVQRVAAGAAAQSSSCCTVTGTMMRAVLGDQLPVLQLALPMTDSVSGVWTSVGHRW
jgi:hypothetical protein